MRGLFREMAIGRRRSDDAHDARVHGAFMAEAFARMKTLPRDPKQFYVQRPQTAAEMRGVLSEIAGKSGIKLTNVVRGKVIRRAQLAHGV